MENVNVWGFVLVILFAAVGAIGSGLLQWWASRAAFDRVKFLNSARRAIISAASSTPWGLIPNLPLACLLSLFSGAGISIGINKSKDSL